jgi:F-type H+-transporting ATPase subunit alpha
VTELLKQAQYAPLSVSLMAVSLFAVNKGYLDDIEVREVLGFEHDLHKFLQTSNAELLKRIEDTKQLSKEDEAVLTSAIENFKKSF